MKNFLLSACLVLTVSFLLPGCQNPHTETIRKVDSLVTELNHIESLLTKVDSAKVRSLMNASVENINFIQKNLDTMSRETAFLVDEYARYKKAFSKWNNKIPGFYSELSLRKEQLTNLKNDMEKNLIEPTEANLYFSGEKLHIGELKSIVTQMESGLSSIEAPYAETDQKIRALIDQLKEQAAI